MTLTERLAALYKNETYSSKQGTKRKPQKVQPNIQYDINKDSMTDKQLELYLIQHKHMVEFLDRKGLLDDFKEYQAKNKVMAGELPSWFRKWN